MQPLLTGLSWRRGSDRSRDRSEPPVAFAVVAAALLDPGESGAGVGRLVGVVLIQAGVHPRLALLLSGVLG